MHGHGQAPDYFLLPPYIISRAGERDSLSLLKRESLFRWEKVQCDGIVTFYHGFSV